MKNDQMILDAIDNGDIVVDLVNETVSNRFGHVLRPYWHNHYMRLSWLVRGKKFRALMHRIIWIAAYGPPPAGTEIGHRNNDKSDYRLDNLHIVTRAENVSDAKRDGLTRNYTPKWKIEAARALADCSVSVSSICRHLKMNRGSVDNAIRRV